MMAFCTLPSAGNSARPGSTWPAGPMSPEATEFSATTTRGSAAVAGTSGLAPVRAWLPKMFARHAVGSRLGATARVLKQIAAKSCWLAEWFVSASSESRQPGSFGFRQRPSLIPNRGRPLTGSTLRL